MGPTTSDFLRDIEIITNYVEGALSLEAAAPVHIDQHLPVRELEEQPLHNLPRRLKEHLDDTESGFNACVERMLDAAGEFVRRSETQLGDESQIVDMLSAAWLGLYFLGITFNDPWERASCIADSIGGFPSGACINKAVGDIYRNARYENSRRADGEKDAVVVLTRRPFLFIPLRKLPEPSQRPVYTRLGRCYASLQLRLYLAAPLPIRYLIPQMALREHLRAYGTAEVAQWIHMMLGAIRSDQRIEVVTAPRTTGGIPTCVLGWNEGVYTLEPGTEDTAEDALIAGSRLSAALASSYRQKISSTPNDRLHRLVPEPFTTSMLQNKLTALAEGDLASMGE